MYALQAGTTVLCFLMSTRRLCNRERMHYGRRHKADNTRTADSVHTTLYNFNRFSPAFKPCLSISLRHKEPVNFTEDEKKRSEVVHYVNQKASKWTFISTDNGTSKRIVGSTWFCLLEEGDGCDKKYRWGGAEACKALIKGLEEDGTTFKYKDNVHLFQSEENVADYVLNTYPYNQEYRAYLDGTQWTP